MDDYMDSMATDRPKFGRIWAWDDASKIVNFMDMHFKKSAKYGLDLGHTGGLFLTKEDLKEKEDRLVDYFLYEMRKPKAEA